MISLWGAVVDQYEEMPKEGGGGGSTRSICSDIAKADSGHDWDIDSFNKHTDSHHGQTQHELKR